MNSSNSRIVPFNLANSRRIEGESLGETLRDSSTDSVLAKVVGFLNTSAGSDSVVSEKVILSSAEDAPNWSSLTTSIKFTKSQQSKDLPVKRSLEFSFRPATEASASQAARQIEDEFVRDFANQDHNVGISQIREIANELSQRNLLDQPLASSDQGSNAKELMRSCLSWEPRKKLAAYTHLRMAAALTVDLGRVVADFYGVDINRIARLPNRGDLARGTAGDVSVNAFIAVESLVWPVIIAKEMPDFARKAAHEWPAVDIVIEHGISWSARLVVQYTRPPGESLEIEPENQFGLIEKEEAFLQSRVFSELVVRIYNGPDRTSGLHHETPIFAWAHTRNNNVYTSNDVVATLPPYFDERGRETKFTRDKAGNFILSPK